MRETERENKKRDTLFPRDTATEWKKKRGPLYE